MGVSVIIDTFNFDLAFSGLSIREREVLSLLIRGKSVMETAEALGVSCSSIGTFRERLLRKVGLRNSVELVLLAVARGAVAAREEIE